MQVMTVTVEAALVKAAEVVPIPVVVAEVELIFVQQGFVSVDTLIVETTLI